MKINISPKEYKIISNWFSVVCGEYDLDKQDKELMSKLDKKFKNI